MLVHQRVCGLVLKGQPQNLGEQWPYRSRDTPDSTVRLARWHGPLSLGFTRPGKHTKNYGKSPFFMGKITIHGNFP